MAYKSKYWTWHPPITTKTKILLLAANPKNTEQLRLDEEFREIKERLRLGTQRESFEIHQGEAIRAKDLLQLLLEFKPDIIHFSGHASSNGIFLEDETGQSHLVNANALTSLFSLLESVECVLLNACYTESQAALIHRHVPYVIGMQTAIGDKAALKFATGFYTALASGETIHKAYRYGCTAIQLAGIDESQTPVIHDKEGLNQKQQAQSSISTAAEKPRSLDTLKDNPKQYDIFISYRTTNREWVEILAKNLKQQGYKIFLDAWELQGGQNFMQTIYGAIKSSHCALLIATPDAAESGWVQREYEIMVQQQQEHDDFFYIPVIFGEFPDFPFLETVQAVDFKDSEQANYSEAFQRLISALNGEAPGAAPSFNGKLEYPQSYQDEHRQLAQQEQSFIEDTFQYLDTGMPIMILGQADTGTQHYANALKRKAEDYYGANNILHIYPPNSTHAK